MPLDVVCAGPESNNVMAEINMHVLMHAYKTWSSVQLAHYVQTYYYADAT